MKKLFIIAVLMIGTMSSWAQKQNPTYLAYIEEWKAIAIQEQEDYGIPASITMAQGLLESSAGQSELAINAKNHFGIKCTNEWFGAVYYHDDDKKDDCFRQYGNAAESFKDHSLFLKRPRYSTCFEIAVEDYEGWARRLKECGYATDPSYAPKLIKLIEDYCLDTLTVSRAVKGSAAVAAAEDTVAKPTPKPQRPLKATIVHSSEPIMVIHNDPEPPYVEPLTAKEERDSFFLMHPRNRCNGIQYVIAREGDTYSNVAFRLNVRERDLREDNDALGRELAKGDRIYLAAKKNTGEEPFVWSHTGQSLWQMSQEVGVKIEAIQKWNELDPQIRTFRTKQRIYLRKIKEEDVYQR